VTPTARGLALAAALALPAAAAGGVRPTWGGALRVSVPVAPRVTDASSEPGDLFVLGAISAPLLRLDAQGRLAPGALAEVPVPEADGRAFRLRLRPDVVDAAGRRLGAVDLAAHLAELLQRAPASPNAFVALPIAGADDVIAGRARTPSGVRVLSETELLVTLAFPLPRFPLLLATPPAGLPGAGAFAVERAAAPGEPLRLVRNDRCFEGRPFADALEVHAREPRIAARLLEKGELDLALRPEAVGARGAALPALSVTVAVVNGDRLGAAAEPLRRALASLDRAELARRFVRGAAEPLATLVPPALLPGAPPPPPPAGRAGAPPPRVALLVNAGAADQRALAERIQVKLYDRGVGASIELVEGETRLLARLARRDFDVALVPVTVLAADAALAAGQIAWVARGADAGRRVTAQLAALGADPAAVVAAADRLAAELGIVPLVATGLRVSASPSLEGLVVRPDGAVDAGGL
jgi:peptide/nickel transport system substrate-binding protein